MLKGKIRQVMKEIIRSNFIMQNQEQTKFYLTKLKYTIHMTGCVQIDY